MKRRGSPRPSARHTQLLSTLLRAWLEFAFRRSATYGPFSTPVAVLLFFYLTGVAILIGAELNAEIDRLWPRAEDAAVDQAARQNAELGP